MDWFNFEKGFVVMIDIIDGMVGKIVVKLKERGIVENILVVFMSDNGLYEEGGYKVGYFDSNGFLWGKKWDLYEGGIRMFMIVSWFVKIVVGS